MFFLKYVYSYYPPWFEGTQIECIHFEGVQFEPHQNRWVQKVLIL